VIPALWAVAGQATPPLAAASPGPGCERVATLHAGGAVTGTGTGGFLRYRWHRPSTGREADKLGLVIRLDARGWLLGTGLYYDDIEQGVAAARAQVVASVNRAVLLTLSGLAAVTLAAAVLVGLGTWQQGRLASRRLQALAHRFVTLQIEERRGFARDLHDGLSQPLAAIAYHLDAARGSDRGQADGAPDPWHQARTALEQAMAEVRRIGEGLRPWLLDDLGLKAALDALLADYARRTGWVTRFECTLAGHMLGEDLEITLYRVAQEALTNVERHAGAARVGLTVAVRGEQVVMTVEDDGRGLADREPVAAPGSGHGLRNMRERVELLGGTLSIASGPGTRVSAMLPIPTDSEEGP
jgi:two-component system NarL family sensor kinase